MLYVKPTHGFNHVELPKYGYTHVNTKDEYGAVGINCTLFTKGTERSYTKRLSYCSFTAEWIAVLLKITFSLGRYIYWYHHVSTQKFS